MPIHPHPRISHAGQWFAPAGLALALGLAGCRQPAPGPAPAPTGPSPTESAAALQSMSSGAPVRFAWLEGPRLYYFDSVQPGPPRILRESATQERPVFTPDGASVLVSDGGTIVATLTTGEHRALGNGYAFATVRAPETNHDWVIATETADGHNVFRFPLQDPNSREPVWTGAPLDPTSAQISRDGHRLTGRFFGQDGGAADARDQKWVKSSGKRPIALAPDLTHISAMLDGTGRRLRFFHPSGSPWDRDSDDLSPPARWQVDLPEAPWAGMESRYTDLRWSHHPHFLALSEPGRGGPARIVLARLSPTAGTVESLAVLAAVGPVVRGVDAWVGGGATASLTDWPASPETVHPAEVDGNDAPLRWPRTYDGISFMWNTRHATNFLPGRDAPCRLTPRGTARFGEWGDLLLDGGTFEADPASARAVAAAATASNAFAIELLLTESTDEEGPLSIRLAALQLTGDRDAFSISRVDHALVFRALLDAGDGTPPREYQSAISPLAITAARPFHLLIEMRDGRVTWSIDGQQVGEPQAIGPASLAGWRPDEVTRLVFGDQAMRTTVDWNALQRPRGDTDADTATQEATLTTVGWRARLEKILILDRGVPFDELRDDRANAAASTTRRPGSIVRVRATLRETTAFPGPGAAATQLVQQIYEIKDVLSGQLEVDPLVVWHWAVLDGQIVPSRPSEIGATYDLGISPLVRHPEVELEETWLGADGVPALAYLDVAPPQNPPRLAPASPTPSDEIVR